MTPARYRFTIELEPSGIYRFRFPELPEVDLAVRRLPEAREIMQDLVLEALETRIKAKKRPPLKEARAGEGIFTLSPTFRAKLLLIDAAEARGVTNAELARMLQIAPQEAQRLLKLRQPTKIDAIGNALAALGYELELGVRER